MAARRPSGRLSRDWWQRRPPKDDTRRLLFKLDRVAWLVCHRLGRYLFDILYERDPVLWAPGRSASRPRHPMQFGAAPTEALKKLEWIRFHLGYLTKLVDEAIARSREAQNCDSDAWLRRQLAGLGKEGV